MRIGTYSYGVGREGERNSLRLQGDAPLKKPVSMSPRAVSVNNARSDEKKEQIQRQRHGCGNKIKL